MAVRKNSKGVYFYSVYFKDKHGKTKRKKVENKDWKKKDALQAERDFLLTVNEGISTITYSELFNLYINERKNKIKNKSIYNITMMNQKHIDPVFGKMQMRKISVGYIEKWQNELINSGYSNKYIYKIQEQLKTVINYGLRYEHIEKNPFKVPIVQNKNEFKREMLFWEKEEFDTFIKVVDDPVFLALFSLLYWTGMRIGEAQALQIKDIDFDNNTISISKTYNAIHKELTTPKTSNSYRTVSITNKLTSLLKDVVESYKSYYGFDGDMFVFGYDEPIRNNKVRRHFNKYIEVAAVKKIRIHDLRHSHVSLLRHLKFDRYEVAKRLGHTPDMVDNTYTHWFEKSQREMIDKLNKLDQ